MRKLTDFVRRTVCPPVRQSVLSLGNSDDGEVGGTCQFRPSDTIETSTIDER
jgi:hypothetical protein